mgnify:FL=1
MVHVRPSQLVAGCWVGGEDQAVRLVSRGEGSVIALPIVGEFLNRIYADPSTGISKQDLFTRPAVMRFTIATKPRKRTTVQPGTKKTNF